MARARLRCSEIRRTAIADDDDIMESLIDRMRAVRSSAGAVSDEERRKHAEDMVMEIMRRFGGGMGGEGDDSDAEPPADSDDEATR